MSRVVPRSHKLRVTCDGLEVTLKMGRTDTQILRLCSRSSQSPGNLRRPSKCNLILEECRTAGLNLCQGMPDGVSLHVVHPR